MSFNWNKYKNLDPGVRETIRQKEKSQTINERSSSENAVKQDIYPTSIFMRLGHSSSNQYNGKDTIKIYRSFCNQNHSVWFSTDSLAKGMAKGKISEFNRAIEDGLILEIYFAIGKNSGGDNEIEYKAQVVDIKSDPDGINSPEKSLTPTEWCEDRNKIWIKLQKLRPCNNYLTVDDFIVVSSGNVLSTVIANSQYQFGYIKRV